MSELIANIYQLLSGQDIRSFGALPVVASEEFGLGRNGGAAVIVQYASL
jgi:hypothetical protein